MNNLAAGGFAGLRAAWAVKTVLRSLAREAVAAAAVGNNNMAPSRCLSLSPPLVVVLHAHSQVLHLLVAWQVLHLLVAWQVLHLARGEREEARWLWAGSAYAPAATALASALPRDCLFLTALLHHRPQSSKVVGGVEHEEAEWLLGGVVRNKEHWATWSRTGGLRVKPLHHPDLRGENISLAALHDPPVTHMKHEKLSGFAPTIWGILRDAYNFSVRPSVPKDGVYGLPVRPEAPGGEWTGMVEEVRSDRANASLNSMASNQARLLVVSFTQPLYRGHVWMLVRPVDRVPGLIAAVRTYASLFEPALWIAVAVCVAVIAALLAAFAAAVTTPTPVGSAPEYSPFSALLAVIGVFCVQGASPDPRAWSVRMALVVGGGACAVPLVAAFGARLVAAFCVPPAPALPFNSAAELLARGGGYTVGTLKRSIYLPMMQNAKDPAISEMYKRLVAPHEERLPSSYAEGLESACREPYVFVLADKMARPQLPGLSCALRPLPQETAFVPIQAGFMTPRRRHHALRRLLRRGLQAIRENGLLALHREREWPSLPPVPTPPVRQVTIDDVAPLLTLLVGVIVISTVLAMMETCIVRAKQCTWTRSKEKRYKKRFRFQKQIKSLVREKCKTCQ